MKTKWARTLAAMIALSVGMTVLSISSTTAALGVTTDTDPDFHTKASAPDADETFDQTGVPDSRRDGVLGRGVEASKDVAFALMTGVDSLTVLRASASDGYAWAGFTTIPLPSIETDLWIFNSCVTSSGKYMAVVYGPRSIMNDERRALGGAWGAVVDLTSGAVTGLGRGFSMAYFDPGCGYGDNFALSRDDGEGNTQIAIVRGFDATVIAKISTPGQVSSILPAPDGRVFGVIGNGIVEITEKGAQRSFVGTEGLAYGLRVIDDQLAYLTRVGKDKAQVQIVGLRSQRPKPSVVAEGSLTGLGLEVSDGRFFVLGDGAVADPRGVVTFIAGAKPGASLSRLGLLAINAAVPVGYASPDSPSGTGLYARVDAVAVETGTALSFRISSIGEVGRVGTQDQTDEGMIELEMLGVHSLENEVSSSSVPRVTLGSSTSPIEGADERYCAVPRNDPNSQAYQPKPRQVEWAVDRAVVGELTELRPANWRNLGMPAYYPQTLFPPVSLDGGGGTIPPQIVLGVLSQESNLWQASRYTAPGNTGNPLVGDYYGSNPGLEDPPEGIWNIDFEDADCGYGVGQITDGMRLAGKQDSDTPPALPADQQRAIALDYAANVAMTIRMLGQKWNEIEAAGMQINGGDSSRIENWFFAVWAYNSGFHAQSGSAPWGVGWFNNPINPIYPTYRTPFLDGNPADAVHPQYWPYPEKVMGFAAHSQSLPETQLANKADRKYPTSFVAAYRASWWNGDGAAGEVNRWNVKPPIDLFCDLSVNDCDPNDLATPCTLSGEPECWWHTDATWKSDCNYSCGYGFERFPSSYATEASSMSSSLPALTLQPSFPPDCSAPPSGTLVVDDVTHAPVRSDCTQQTTQGSFAFEFQSPDANGSYSAKVDLHQLGGGFNGHFYFSHMRKYPDSVNNVDNRLKITGTWTLGQQLHQWARVWVHLPDHAAWTDQAAYTINFGNGQSQTRYLPQKRYENTWVPIGVFLIDGVPSVSLSNILTALWNEDIDDVAWDAVGFQPLSAKPADFVVALGDSFSSGEGAWSYDAWSDHGGTSTGQTERNACHQSANAWIRKTTIPGRTNSIGALETAGNSAQDFHFLACSGAETEQLLPFYTYSGPGSPPQNSEGQNGELRQYGLVSQLDAGYLDADTTLVTLTIGGNDMRFSEILGSCITFGGFCGQTLDGDSEDMATASADRLQNELPDSIATVLDQIKTRAPNANIVLMGYPRLFDLGGGCIGIDSSNLSFLNGTSDGLRDVLATAADAADSVTQRVLFVDPQSSFVGYTLCANPSAINGLLEPFSPGDLPWGLWPDIQTPVAQSSVHPNTLGTDLYSVALEDALDEIYP